MYSLILAFREFLRTKPKVDLNSVVTQAAAYGFEIGAGAPMLEEINMSPTNPFTDSSWRKLIHTGKENDF